MVASNWQSFINNLRDPCIELIYAISFVKSALFSQILRVRGVGFEPTNLYRIGASVLRLWPCLATPALMSHQILNGNPYATWQIIETGQRIKRLYSPRMETVMNWLGLWKKQVRILVNQPICQLPRSCICSQHYSNADLLEILERLASWRALLLYPTFPN